jgi:hypothetical protein
MLHGVPIMEPIPTYVHPQIEPTQALWTTTAQGENNLSSTRHHIPIKKGRLISLFGNTQNNATQPIGKGPLSEIIRIDDNSRPKTKLSTHTIPTIIISEPEAPDLLFEAALDNSTTSLQENSTNGDLAIDINSPNNAAEGIDMASPAQVNSTNGSTKVPHSRYGLRQRKTKQKYRQSRARRSKTGRTRLWSLDDIGHLSFEGGVLGVICEWSDGSGGAKYPSSWEPIKNLRRVNTLTTLRALVIQKYGLDEWKDQYELNKSFWGLK